VTGELLVDVQCFLQSFRLYFSEWTQYTHENADEELFTAWSAFTVADLDVWPEGAHAFTNMGTPLAVVALDRTTSWISDLLDRADTSREKEL
jgi:hypothetical protein